MFPVTENFDAALGRVFHSSLRLALFSPRICDLNLYVFWQRNMQKANVFTRNEIRLLSYEFIIEMWCFPEQSLCCHKKQVINLMVLYLASLVGKQNIKPPRPTKPGDQHPLKGDPAKDILDEHYNQKVSYWPSILRCTIHCDNLLITSFKVSL